MWIRFSVFFPEPEVVADQIEVADQIDIVADQIEVVADQVDKEADRQTGKHNYHVQNYYSTQFLGEFHELSNRLWL